MKKQNTQQRFMPQLQQDMRYADFHHGGTPDLDFAESGGEALFENAEQLATCVRPAAPDCAAVLSDAKRRLKKAGAEFGSYRSGKDGVYQTAAAIFSAIQKSPKGGRAAPLQMGVFACGCLEAAGLHPVLAVGERSVGVGVWLCDSSFLSSVTDDCETVGKYLEKGISNLCFFHAEDLFSGRTSFSAAQAHFCEALKAGKLEYFVDIHRCRLAGIEPACTQNMSGEAPAPLPPVEKPKGELPKNKIWERELLDFSARNALLNFTGKHALHFVSDAPDALYLQLCTQKRMRLTEDDGEAAPFGRACSPQEAQQIALEQSEGILRVRSEGKLAETALSLMRRGREADEETGAKILYCAFGFLRFCVGAEARYAPIVLAPAELKREKGSGEFYLSLAERECFVNTTLLEFLKQEYDIDLHGWESDAPKLSEIFSLFNAETANRSGWRVEEDAYLAAFSFRRFCMWNDLRQSFDKMKQNALVNALFDGRPVPQSSEKSAREQALSLPLSADSSQRNAVALSDMGASFVLHGPPGTGKSQTIANMIALALARGKRVLFVAEKRAALEVVKRRLDGIGIGNFCLPLYSDKSKKEEVLARMRETLRLAHAEKPSGFSSRVAESEKLRQELEAPLRALNEKRQADVSVFQALESYLERRDVPDLLEIGAAFYEGLTEQKFVECRSRILAAAAAARECGSVCHSPFDEVNLTEYSLELRDKLRCAAEGLLAEIRHLKAYSTLFLSFYRQQIVLTEHGAAALSSLADELAAGKYDEYFKGADEAEFQRFYRANKTLDEKLGYYFRHFKTLVHIENAQALAAECDSRRRGDASRNALKKLARVALHPIAEEDHEKYLSLLVQIHAAMQTVAGCVTLAAPFLARGGRINFKCRTEYLSPLYDLHERCETLFLDFNPDAFNAACVRGANGVARPVLEGFCRAEAGYALTRERYLTLTRASGERCGEEIDVLEARVNALLDNLDVLPSLCAYRKTMEELKTSGLHFDARALECGNLNAETVLASFEKSVYKSILEGNLASDPVLQGMAGGTLEAQAEKFRMLQGECMRLTQESLLATLTARLPLEESEGALAAELATFNRLSGSGMRGTSIRGLLSQIPTLTGILAPCMLMSPTAVAQYLKMEPDSFDLVIFDEASQMTTAEAIGAIARSKAAVVVGDPNQLPPTPFFQASVTDAATEDAESILDACLALGMPERHLRWHYRSKHESLIAFSASTYYEGRLCTFPSPDAQKSRVRLIKVQGAYDRGFTKRNQAEAEALVEEVIRRLSDAELSRMSMGIVTFSSAQQEAVERLLAARIAKNGLESVAYEREEPIFVKNLENVQGDERDVILFSVCYGPDRAGRLSFNFGPLNRAGGWRRLNVAVSRAREEMLVFSAMTAPMIDLSRASSKGAVGLKAFLDFAEHGRMRLAEELTSPCRGTVLAKCIAKALKSSGYPCRCSVGSSDFKVDIAVLDPKNPQRFLLGILLDGAGEFSAEDAVMQAQALRRGGWQLLHLNPVRYYDNPGRELKRIRDTLERLTGRARRAGICPQRYKRPYRAVKATALETASFITGGEHDEEISVRLREIVGAEQPISRAFLKKRLLQSFGIRRSGKRALSRLDALIDGCAFPRDRIGETDYFYRSACALSYERVRVERGERLRRAQEDFTPYEVIALIKGTLEERLALYPDEISPLIEAAFGVHPEGKLLAFVERCIAYGREKGIFVRSVSDRLTLA